jgi:hypothetical protein
MWVYEQLLRGQGDHFPSLIDKRLPESDIADPKPLFTLALKQHSSHPQQYHKLPLFLSRGHFQKQSDKVAGLGQGHADSLAESEGLADQGVLEAVLLKLAGE